MKKLLEEIRACDTCKAHLPLGPNPIVSASKNSRMVIIGQAPGTKVHNTSIPWNDPSGNLLRDWLGIDKDIFYNEEKIALIPMGFCYPGKGKSGDMPPRPECAPLWHEKLLKSMPHLELTILIGQYSQAHYLGNKREKNLTETVRNYREYLPSYLPLPHPSPRNRIWLKRNEWFEHEVLPTLRATVKKLIA